MSAAKKLLIVESPTKARTITRMVGNEFNVLASMGHIRDLPEHDLGVDIEHDFAPVYVANPRSKRVVADLVAAAKKADAIYLAPDPDREGEAIAWHLQEVLQKNFKGPFLRVSFHEITRSAITNALEHGGEVNMQLVDAQQARRVLDRLVGYRISPLLWSQVAKGSSAGRVQSVALRLIVERERTILDFQPEEYWNFKLQLRSDTGVQFEVKLAKINGKNFKIDNENDAAQALTAILNGRDLKVAAIRRTKRLRHAPPPFTTSTLQQTANQLLHFAATSTMRHAQALYEGVDLGAGGATGLITYMRTDSVNIAKEAQSACLDFIGKTYGAEYLPKKPNFYKSKSSAQEAHEAIRPTDVTRTPESIEALLDPQEFRLYRLIWRRFVASQMSEAVLEQLNVSVTTNGADQNLYDFRATATATIFPGFTTVSGSSANNSDEENGEEGTLSASDLLAQLREQEPCTILDSRKEQKFTEPPPRFTEATLIKELEENGIGRPSTYATILQTIQQRKYVAKEQGKLVPTELGFKVTDFLVKMLPELFEVKFTSMMEEELDDVEAGTLPWTKMMADFYEKFVLWLKAAKSHGAVDSNRASELLTMMHELSWQPPVKNGRFTKDDKKFFTSVEKSFEKSGEVTARQFQALLDLALQYQTQLPKLQDCADRNGFADDLNAAQEREAARQAKAAAAEAQGLTQEALSGIFQAFADVPWSAPTTKRGRTYDDKKFFTSLEKQFQSGKALSEKQLGALGKIAQRYQESLKNFEQISSLLHLDAPAANAEDGAASPESAAAANSHAAELLKLLDAVVAWAPAEKKGRRTYDDKAFYLSLKEQHEGKRTLSVKQLAALEKLAKKYCPASSATPESEQE